MNKTLELKLEEYLEFKKFSDLSKINDTDLDGINQFVNSCDQVASHSNDYFVIIFRKRVNGKLLKLYSSKLYFNLDYIKMKIYLNGYLKLNHNSIFSSYFFDVSIFNQL